MKIPEKILITVFFNDNYVDIEVPTDINVFDFKNKLVIALNMYYKNNNLNKQLPDAINLYYENKSLENDKLLINYGIWDGSMIFVR